MKVYSFGALDGFPDQLEAPAFLIEQGLESWLVDVPTHINLMLRQIQRSPMDLTAILVTHLHNDHVGGLIDLIQLRMLCLAKPDIMRQAGYYDQVASRVLPIYVLGYQADWWAAIEKLIDFNCPDVWGSWKDYHQVIFLDKKSVQGEIELNTITVQYRKSAHDIPCYGLKIGGLAISGDGPYDASHVAWLVEHSKLVFHEAGFGGSHTRAEDFATVVGSHSRLFLYHMPFPVREMVVVQGMLVAEKGWYDV